MPALTTITELADEIGVNKSAVSRHAKRLGLGTPVKGMVALTRREADLLKRAVAEAEPGNPNFKAR